MNWLLNGVVVIILLIALVGAMVLGCTEKDANGNSYFKVNKRVLLAFIPGILLIAYFSIKIVPANNVGIRWSMFGGTSEKTMNEGFNFVSPLDKVYLIDTTVQERTIKDIRVQTKDAQSIVMQINVKYRIDQKNAFKVYKGYKTLENLNKSIIRNYAEEALLQIGTQYNVIDILGDKNNEFHDQVIVLLEKRLNAEGVEFKSITFKDIDAGEAIEKAIANEAVAKKKVETAEQNKLKAKKDAETKVIKAQAEADANAILTEKLSNEILQKMWIEKWNGKLPNVVGSEGMMIDVSSTLK